MNTITNSNWNEILIRFKEEFDIPNVSFKTWIAPLSFQSIDDDTVHIVYNGIIPDAAVNYIESKYLNLLKLVIQDVTGKDFQKIVISTNESHEPKSLFPTISFEEYHDLQQRINELELENKTLRRAAIIFAQSCN
jgi:chromosomal replication initiator protein